MPIPQKDTTPHDSKIDKEKWEQMLVTKTIPFELPEPAAKIAVKVINQTGMKHTTVLDDPRVTIEQRQQQI